MLLPVSGGESLIKRIRFESEEMSAAWFADNYELN